jgi:seryl-tRNA synthetase
MLDIRLLRETPDLVKQRLANRGGDHASLVDEVLAIDAQRRAAETERQKLQGDRNRISKEIGIAKKNGQDTSSIEAEVRGIGSRIDEIGREADASDAKQRDLLLSIPNLPHEACPVGHSAEENPEVRVWGAKPEFSFQPKDHTAVAGALGMIDFEAGAKITGSAFVVYTHDAARLSGDQPAAAGEAGLPFRHGTTSEVWRSGLSQPRGRSVSHSDRRGAGDKSAPRGDSAARQAADQLCRLHAVFPS